MRKPAVRCKGGIAAALGERGLRPPMAPMDGPDAAARERGRRILRERLQAIS